MSTQNIPEDSKKEINHIVSKYQQRPDKVISEYWKLYNQPFLNNMFKPTNPSDIAARHNYTKDMLKADYQTRSPTVESTIIPFGKGGISVFPGQEPTARIWVINMKNKMKSCVNLTYDVLKEGFLDKVLLFNTYQGINVVPQSDGWMGIDDRVFPLPSPQPIANAVASAFFSKLKIPSVKIKELGLKEKRSKTTTEGKYVYSDIKCIRGVTIARSSITDGEHKGWKYKRGMIVFTDNSNEDEFTTDDGIVVPKALVSFCSHSYAYTRFTQGDAYGVIRVDTKKQLRFDLCYFDPTRVPEYGQTN